MPRDLTIVRRIDVMSIDGLVPLPDSPEAFPLWWHAAEGGRPRIVRFVWLPMTGEARVGCQPRHALMLPSGGSYPFEAYLRGFAFPRDSAVALRTYFWPADHYDEFDRAHAALDRRVAGAFLRLLRPHLPRGTAVHTGIDNRFLRSRYGHLSMDW